MVSVRYADLRQLASLTQMSAKVHMRYTKELTLMTLPLDLDWYILKGQASLLSTRNIQQLRLKNKVKKFITYSKLSNKK